ncbi:MAG: hypothetical protein AABZ47_00955 [Planctomycetota bacterium]
MKKGGKCPLGWVALVFTLCSSGTCSKTKQVEQSSGWRAALRASTVAVAPAVNLSGSLDFDRNRFADLMAIELTEAEGVTVIPVSRVIAVLSGQGRETVGSPQQVAELGELLQADAVLVFAVTAYEPYQPPVIGISAQLYGRAQARAVSSSDTRTAFRQQHAGDSNGPDSWGLLAQTQRVFHGGDDSVRKEVQRYAKTRTAEGSPYGWRKFFVSQQDYIRFCCFSVIGALLEDAQRNDKIDIP